MSDGYCRLALRQNKNQNKKMNVRLTQIDGKLPNLALMKLSHFHKSQGDNVFFEQSIVRGLFEPNYNIVYGSAIFSTSQKKIAQFKENFKGAIVGGTGTNDNCTTVEKIINFANREKLPLLIIGNGTNLLFPDNEVKGIVMRIGEPYLCKVSRNKDIVKSQAGISLSSLLNFTIQEEFSGLEFMAGIPGTLGGAITMNAGAYGKRIGEFVAKVEVMDKKCKIYWLNNSELGFGYRKSRFQLGDEIILSAILEFPPEADSPCAKKPVKHETIKTKIEEILKHRKANLPLDFSSAGCVFKNSTQEPAGKLIELAGCKGLKIGDAEVSTKHANFIINKGKATSEDVKSLIAEVRKRVYKQFKVSLELEIRVL